MYFEVSPARHSTSHLGLRVLLLSLTDINVSMFTSYVSVGVHITTLDT